MSIDFTKTYDRETALSFLRDNFLPEDFNPLQENISLPESPTRKITEAYLLGEVHSLDLKVYEFTHKSAETDPRVTITKEAFRLLAERGEQRSLVFFISNNSHNYRLSLITIDLKPDNKKIKKIISNPRRYSYYLGPNAKVKTPTNYLIKRGRITSFEDLKSRFSIEVVNKEFFGEISKYFMELVGGKIGKTDYGEGLLKLPSTTDHIKKQEFAVRLIGRIIFCYFLKKKNSIQGKPLMPEKLLSSCSIEPNYYHNVLEPLFFEVLNKPLNERNQKYRSEIFDTIPFLNGGLFEAHTDDFYETDNQLKISRYINTLLIPDEWFKDFFETLETYNFTIDENTSTDIDLSVDPEMLGRIFENLLAEINPETGETARKATGSYYTPREIVDYMVGQSLKYYLLEKTKISEEKIDQLIQNTFDTIELSNASKEEIIDALSSLTVIDPACGSGAFPMGILQKTVSILNEIDPDSKLWLDKQLKKINDNLLKDTMRKKLDKETINYIFKLGLIKNSIYGVDIQEIAVELSKLRVFLSLIVDAYVDDSKENRGLEPLPNLEFKFVCANSLIDLPEEKHYLVDAKTGYSNKLIEELKKLREDYFRSYGSEKERIKKEFKEKQKQLLDIFMEWGKNMEDKKSFMLSEWDPFSDKPSSWFNPEWMFGLKDGFDIVIANPPYVRQERIKEQKSYLESQGYEVFNGTADLYTYFYEKGYNLLKNNGILVFISSNKWMRAKYGECLRKFIKERTKISEVIDFGGQKVFDATVDTNILIFKALKQQNSNLKKDNKSQEMIYKENTFNGISVKEDFNIGTGIYDYVRNNSIQLKQDEIDSRTFLIADGGTLSLKAKIEKIGKPLKDWGVRICFGIKTGFNEAFIIDTATRNEILSNCKTEEERKRTEEIIKPILRGRDIGRYYYKWADLWIIKIESGWTNKKIIDAPPLSFPNASIGNPEDKTKALALKMFQETYPAIYNYLISFANVKGKSKGKGLFNRDDQGDYWWELRDCDYYPEFEKEKIVWAEMTDEPAFVLDNLKFYTNQTAYIMTGKNLKYVIGILNSKISHFYLTKIAYSLSQNANRWIKQYVEQLPLPLITPQNQSIADQIVQLVDQILSLTQSEDYLQNLQKQAKVKELERKIDKLVYKLYDLTNEEVTIVEKGFVNESDK